MRLNLTKTSIFLFGYFFIQKNEIPTWLIEDWILSGMFVHDVLKLAAFTKGVPRDFLFFSSGGCATSATICENEADKSDDISHWL